MVPSFRSFPNPRPKTRGAGLWRGRQNEKQGWISKSDLFHLKFPWGLFSILTVCFNHLSSKFIAKCRRSLTCSPNQSRSAQALHSLSPHIPPLQSPARWPGWPPHLPLCGGAHGGACRCDGWVCGSGPWTTPAACPVEGSMPQTCRDGR